jgi:hypothetical protein
MNGEECGGKQPRTILMHYPRICVEDVRKSKRNLVKIDGLCTSVRTYDLANMKKIANHSGEPNVTYCRTRKGLVNLFPFSETLRKILITFVCRRTL